ncbi:MAG: ferredoxin reductase family protein [Candidatus Peregrinibacteria bacterium]|nr:ferredoxin reductase family protein [Candidatus Peregrinibacteria bacterium]
MNIRRTIIFGVLGLNFVLTFMLWRQGSFDLLTSGATGDSLIAYGRLGGLLAQLFIVLELILVGRITFIEQEFGHLQMNKIHRLVGYFLLGFFFVHPILLVMGYDAQSGRSFTAQFINFLMNWENVFAAFVGLILFLGLTVFSIAIIRRKVRYETWYVAHLGMYVAIFLTLGHQTEFGDFADNLGWAMYWNVLNVSVLALLFVYRFGRPALAFYKHRFVIQKVVQEGGGVTSLYITGKNLDRFSFKPGQFVNLLILSRKHFFAHPFSFSAAPNGEYLRFSIKDCGDFTCKVCLCEPGTSVIIDGPLGVFTEQKSETDKYLLVAGGIGITPIRALAEALSREGKDVVLMYAARTQNDLIFHQELEAFSCKRSYILNDVEQKDQLPGYEYGRIDLERIQKSVPDFAQRDAYICGPAPMILSLEGQLKGAGVPDSQLHSELFMM